ncbi:MAG: GNAT family N-acetyltransferase [Acidobacteriota bacterium]
MTQPLNIIHRPDMGRFETHIEGLQCEVDYRLDDHTMHITHTGVPQALEGRGIAAGLVQHALTWAREQGHKVHPVCSYVQVYIRRHPEWSDILA